MKSYSTILQSVTGTGQWRNCFLINCSSPSLARIQKPSRAKTQHSQHKCVFEVWLNCFCQLVQPGSKNFARAKEMPIFYSTANRVGDWCNSKHFKWKFLSTGQKLCPIRPDSRSEVFLGVHFFLAPKTPIVRILEFLTEPLQITGDIPGSWLVSDWFLTFHPGTGVASVV